MSYPMGVGPARQRPPAVTVAGYLLYLAELHNRLPPPRPSAKDETTEPVLINGVSRFPLLTQLLDCQVRRRRVHQKQNPASRTATAMKMPVSASCRGQKWLAGW